jgi:hypothetical protein
MYTYMYMYIFIYIISVLSTYVSLGPQLQTDRSSSSLKALVPCSSDPPNEIKELEKTLN